MRNSFITEELFRFPLYKKIPVDENLPTYRFFPYNDLRVEGYCDKCKCKRIYSFENSVVFMEETFNSYQLPKIKGIDDICVLLIDVVNDFNNVPSL